MSSSVDPLKRRQNLRLGLLMAAVAAAFFFGIMLRWRP